MECIKNLLAPHVELITSSSNEMVALVNKMFEIQNLFLESIINLNWQTSKSNLAIVGGIMINTD